MQGLILFAGLATGGHFEHPTWEPIGANGVRPAAAGRRSSLRAVMEKVRQDRTKDSSSGASSSGVMTVTRGTQGKGRGAVTDRQVAHREIRIREKRVGPSRRFLDGERGLR